jgi:hypothetical protein
MFLLPAFVSKSHVKKKNLFAPSYKMSDNPGPAVQVRAERLDGIALKNSLDQLLTYTLLFAIGGAIIFVSSLVEGISTRNDAVVVVFGFLFAIMGMSSFFGVKLLKAALNKALVYAAEPAVPGGQDMKKDQ